MYRFSHSFSQCIMAKGRRVLRADGLTYVCSLSWTRCLFTLHNRPQVFSLSVCPASLGFPRPLGVITQTTLLITVWSRGGPFLQQKSHLCFSDTLFSHLFRGVCFVVLWEGDYFWAGLVGNWFSTCSPVLGNHFSLYWFRCLSLLVFCHAFVDRWQSSRDDPQVKTKRIFLSLEQFRSDVFSIQHAFC